MNSIEFNCISYYALQITDFHSHFSAQRRKEKWFYWESSKWNWNLQQNSIFLPFCCIMESNQITKTFLVLVHRIFKDPIKCPMIQANGNKRQENCSSERHIDFTNEGAEENFTDVTKRRLSIPRQSTKVLFTTNMFTLVFEFFSINEKLTQTQTDDTDVSYRGFHKYKVTTVQSTRWEQPLQKSGRQYHIWYTTSISTHSLRPPPKWIVSKPCHQLIIISTQK